LITNSFYNIKKIKHKEGKEDKTQKETEAEEEEEEKQGNVNKMPLCIFRLASCNIYAFSMIFS
jgi:hypothetical protein